MCVCVLGVPLARLSECASDCARLARIIQVDSHISRSVLRCFHVCAGVLVFRHRVEGETCGQDFVCRSWRCRWQCGHEHARRLVADCFYYISASNGEGCITNGYQWLSWKTNVLNAAWHTEGEQELRSCGARLTFLRPTMFYSSILQASKPPALASKCARCIGT